jgi:transposase
MHAGNVEWRTTHGHVLHFLCLMLPKYSPDLNPIELPYSKFKGLLRKVAARTVPGLYRAIRSFVPQLSA